MSETIPLVLDLVTGQLVPQGVESTIFQDENKTFLQSSNILRSPASPETMGSKTSVKPCKNTPVPRRTVAGVTPFSVSGKNQKYEVFSVLSSNARISALNRKLSRVKCQCTNHIIMGNSYNEGFNNNAYSYKLLLFVHSILPLIILI